MALRAENRDRSPLNASTSLAGESLSSAAVKLAPGNKSSTHQENVSVCAGDTPAPNCQRNKLKEDSAWTSTPCTASCRTGRKGAYRVLGKVITCHFRNSPGNTTEDTTGSTRTPRSVVRPPSSSADRCATTLQPDKRIATSRPPNTMHTRFKSIALFYNKVPEPCNRTANFAMQAPTQHSARLQCTPVKGYP